jgi:hypothetical protein
MKNISVKLFSSIAYVCLSILILSCLSSPMKQFDAVDIVPQGSPSPFEGTWEAVDGPPHLSIPNRNAKFQYVFHLNTWEQLSDQNEYGIMTLMANGTFTYDNKILTMKYMNVGFEGRVMSVEGVIQSMPKKDQAAMRNGPPYLMAYTYELNNTGLLLFAPAYTQIVSGRKIDVPASRVMYRKVTR